MGTQVGQQDLDVSRTMLGELLRTHPGRFNFFQAVRVLERLQKQRQRVGEFGDPTGEAVRFGVNNSLAFPPSQINAIEWDESAQPSMTVNFMGLTGPNGVLPHTYTEFVRDRIRAKDPTLRDFLDIFNHRMISLFYRAWEKYRFYVSYERDQQDRFSRYLMSFAGLGTSGLEHRQKLRDETFLFYCGLLALQPRSAVALEQILNDYFEVPVSVEQFAGSWRALAESDLCLMDEKGGCSAQLGVGAVAGDEIWDRQSRARIVLGPLSIETYCDFLPGGGAYEPLRNLMDFFSNRQVEFEVQLVLKKDDVPACELIDPGQLLGWTTWMKATPFFERDPADTILLLS